MRGEMANPRYICHFHTPIRMPDTDAKKKQQYPERDYTAGGILGSKDYRGSTGNEEIDGMVSELVESWRVGENQALIEEMIITALNIGHDNMGVAELKLLNRNLKELRKADNVFRPYSHRRKVTVYGSARTKPGEPEFEAAKTFSKTMQEHGCMVITGAGHGIMGAANEGAGRRDSFGLNIALPFEQSANETVLGDHKLITFNYFFTRKLTFVKEADGVALFPGGFGTMDEGFELLTLMQTGKAKILPIVMVDAPGGTYWKTFVQFLEEHLLRLELISEEDFSLFKVTDDLDEAVDELLTFYRNFHSYRWVGDQLIFRLLHPLTKNAVAKLGHEFDDILQEPGFKLRPALPEECDEPTLERLPRLVCTPHHHRYGRHRELIDAINLAACES